MLKNKSENKYSYLPSGPNGTADRLKATDEQTETTQNNGKKRPFRKMFQKKQTYKVAAENGSDESQNGQTKKRQKVGRVSSIGRSFRNLLSCSSSVTTV